jgi:hypothetical protein
MGVQANKPNVGGANEDFDDSEFDDDEDFDDSEN